MPNRAAVSVPWTSFSSLHVDVVSELEKRPVGNPASRLDQRRGGEFGHGYVDAGTEGAHGRRFARYADQAAADRESAQPYADRVADLRAVLDHQVVVYEGRALRSEGLRGVLRNRFQFPVVREPAFQRPYVHEAGRLRPREGDHGDETGQAGLLPAQAAEEDFGRIRKGLTGAYFEVGAQERPGFQVDRGPHAVAEGPDRNQRGRAQDDGRHVQEQPPPVGPAVPPGHLQQPPDA